MNFLGEMLTNKNNSLISNCEYEMNEGHNPEPTSEGLETDIDWSRVEMTPADSESGADDEPLAYDGRDGLLHYFNQRSYLGFSFGITIFVNGLTISGRIIPGNEYLEGLQVPFDGFDEGTWASLIHADLAKIKAYEDGNRNKAGYLEILNFLHLKDARVFIPGKRGLPSNGSLMRFKIESIDGWSHGVLETSA